MFVSFSVTPFCEFLAYLVQLIYELAIIDLYTSNAKIVPQSHKDTICVE